MSETPIKIIVDLSKPEGEREQIIPLTEDEIAEREAIAAEAIKRETAQKKELAAKEAARKSALTKLSELGLTDSEISALIG
jgi:hypothetical protein